MTSEKRLDRLLRLRALQAGIAAAELVQARTDLREVESDVARLQDLRADERDEQERRLLGSDHEAWLFGLSQAALLEGRETALRSRVPALQAQVHSMAQEEKRRRLEQKQISSLLDGVAKAGRAAADRAEEKRLGDQFLALRLWQQGHATGNRNL